MIGRGADTRETPEDEGPRDRASRMAEAILEIGARLDPDSAVRRKTSPRRSDPGADTG